MAPDKTRPHHYVLLIMLTSCCFFTLFGIEIVLVGSYYTAITQPKNNKFMAHASGKIQPENPKRLLSRRKRSLQSFKKKKNLQITSSSAFSVYPQPQTPAHSAAGRCTQVNWLTWRFDRSLPDMKGGVNLLKLAREWKSLLLSLFFFWLNCVCLLLFAEGMIYRDESLWRSSK